MKRRIILSLILLLGLLAFAGAGAEEADFPELNEQGFLDSGEFLYENPEEGLWRYASDTLWVEIHRIIQPKPARTWYEAEIRCAEGGDVPHMIPLDPEKWMKARDYPYKLARTHQTVIAVSADYAWHRVVNKARVGILVWDGVVYSEKTRKKGAKQFPNLDNLALFPDGDMQVFDSDEKTAQEYLDNLQDLQARQEAATEQILSEARQEAEAARAAADEYSQTTRAQVDAYWDRVFDKAQALLTAQDNLREVVEAGKDTEAV